ncbi:hypothetical protein CU306_02005 [Prochlorococcus marinus str. MU1414]|uniref:hypothetical protein n=1 Tax=Prochlorococcus marinus TaxID=1219 RepID=UPI001C57F04A|nr:hypothetical protein [Prochlorococcus marinus]MBW3045238.1 hypothetical protein [Prochlorococcus marinus str. MU1414]
MIFKKKEFFLLIFLIFLQSCSGGRIGNFLESSFNDLDKTSKNQDLQNNLLNKNDINLEKENKKFNDKKNKKIKKVEKQKNFQENKNDINLEKENKKFNDKKNKKIKKVEKQKNVQENKNDINLEKENKKFNDKKNKKIKKVEKQKNVQENKNDINLEKENKKFNDKKNKKIKNLSKKRKIELQSYKIIFILKDVDPKDPTEELSSILSNSEVNFEIEKIERIFNSKNKNMNKN